MRLNHQVKKVLLILLFLICLLVLAFLVWGDSIRMARANTLFSGKRLSEANKIYANLAVERPNSPHVLHNLALCAYENNQLIQALQVFSSGLEILEKAEPESSSPPSKPQELDFKYLYHLGNTNFKLAEEEEPEGAKRLEYLQGALANYRKALLIDPSDLEAKYNYELTKLHLQNEEEKKREKVEEEPDQTENDETSQDNEGRKDEEMDQDGTTDDSNSSTDAPTDKQLPLSPKNSAGEYSRSEEEVKYLLTLVEGDEEYYAPQNSPAYYGESKQGTNMQAEKDW